MEMVIGAGIRIQKGVSVLVLLISWMQGVKE